MSDSTRPVELLGHLDGLRTRARNDRRAGSTPLLVLGAATVVAAALPDGGLSLPYSFYWVLAGPLVFAVTAGLFRRRADREGVGTPTRSYRGAAIVLVIVFLLLFPLATLFGAGMAVIGLGLLVLGMRQHHRPVAVTAVVFGVVGVLETSFVITNGVWHLTGRTVGSSVVVAMLGLVIVGVGLGLRAREAAGS